MWELKLVFGEWANGENVNLGNFPMRWTGTESNDRVKSFIVAWQTAKINQLRKFSAIRQENSKKYSRKKETFSTCMLRYGLRKRADIQTISHSRRVTITNSLIKHWKCKSTFHDTTAKSLYSFPFSHSIGSGWSFELRSLKNLFFFILLSRQRKPKLQIRYQLPASSFTWKSNVHELIKLCRWLNGQLDVNERDGEIAGVRLSL